MEKLRATFLWNGGWGRLTGLLAGVSLLLLGPTVLAVEVDRVALCEDVNQSGSTECDGADIRFQQDISANRQFGFSVAMGYLNDDNFADVVIGDPGESRVYVIYGGVDNASPAEDLNDRALENADLVLTLNVTDAGLGSSIAIGSIDATNNAVIIGAPAIDDATLPGTAYVIGANFWAGNPSGTFDVTQVATATLVGEQAGDQAGYSVSLAPVLSAGTDDFVVGARLAQGSRGRVYAVGSAVMGTVNLGIARMVTGATARDDANDVSGDGLGEYLATADFVTGDGGVHEIAIGAVGAPPDEQTNIGGLVYLVNVSAANIDLSVTNVRTIEGVNPNDFFGFTLVAGDFDGNGQPDLVAGAIYADRVTPDCATDEKNAGALYYFPNGALQGILTTQADVGSKILWGFRKWDELGFGLAAGDVNNDLDVDLIASARSHDRNQVRFDEVNEGAVYVFQGGPASIFTTATAICLDCDEPSCDPLPAGVDAMIFGGDYDLGSSTSEQVGFSLAAGDFNGDSLFDDISMSSTAHDRVYLVTLTNTDGVNTNPDGQITDDFRDIRDRDDDGDGYLDVLEDENLDGIVNGDESDPLVPNRDVAVSITTPGNGSFECTDPQTVTATVTNSGLLSLNDPQLQVDIPDALQSGGVRPVYEYILDSTQIDGQPVDDALFCQDTLAACNDDTDCPGSICGIMPFTAPRSLTVDGNPLATPLAADDVILVTFDLAANLKIEIGTDTADTVDAEVTLDAPEDPNELDPANPLAGDRQDSAPVSLNLPLLSIIKVSTDVNGAPLEPEDIIRYRVTLANPGGAAPAFNVLLTDDTPAKTLFVASSSTCEIDGAACPGGTVTEPATPSGGTLTASIPSLDIGSTAIITFDVTVDQEQINDGDSIDNVAVASEDCVEDKQSSTSDTVTVDTSINVNKLAVPDTLVEPGGPVDYNVTVTNAGNIRLTITSLMDDVYGNITDPGNPAFTFTDCAVPTDINPGESYACTFSLVVNGANAGDVILDMVTATVETPTGVDTDTAFDTATVTITDAPSSILVAKSAVPTTVNEPGEDVTFTVLVTNTSAADAVTLTLIEDDADNDGTVDQSFNPAAVCDDDTLLPSQQATCTFVRLVSGNPGDTITDNVIVTGEDDDVMPVTGSDTATVTVVDVPSSISVVKTATPDNVDEPGGLVDFTVVVTNTSPVDTVTLTLIEDDENNDGAVDQTYVPAAVCDETVLAPTEVATCTFSHQVTGDPGDTITDAVTVSGTDDDAVAVSGGDTATVTINDAVSAITVVKTATPDNVDEPGGLVDFTVQVTNDSAVDTVTLTLIEDDEDNDGAVDQSYDPVAICDATVLAPTEVATCTFNHQVNGNGGDTVTDAVTVSGTDDDTLAVSGSDTATVTINDLPSSITVVKTATPDNVDEPGGPVDFTVQVTNDSAVDTVTLTLIEDDENNDGAVDQSYNPVTICNATVLAPTEVAVCTFSHPVNGNAGDVITDAVTVSGTDDDSVAVSGGDTATVTINDVPSSISVVKTATPDTIPDPGGDVTFEVTVTNTSLVDTVTLTLIEDDETDDGTVDTSYLPAVICDSAVLLPTEVATCSFVRAVAGTAGETFTDRVTVSGTDDDAVAVNGEATATVTIAPPLDGPSSQLSIVSPGGSQFEWNASSSATSYHLYRGDLQELVDSGTYAQDPDVVGSAAQMCWLSDTQYDDAFVPEVGTVVFYLVTSDDGASEGELGPSRQNVNPCRQ